jgi:hypothetical protein
MLAVICHPKHANEALLNFNTPAPGLSYISGVCKCKLGEASRFQLTHCREVTPLDG